MSVDIKIPTVGESVSSAIIAQWHKGNGALVATGDLLLTLETDKISTEITAQSAGVLEILVAEGQEMAIGATVGRITEAATSTPASSASVPPSPPSSAATPELIPVLPTAARKPETGSRRKAPVSPVVMRLAKEYGIDLSLLVGTGKRGAILKKDVQACIDNGGKSAPAPKDSPAALLPDLRIKPAAQPEPVAPAVEENGRITRKRLSPMRRKIAAQLVSAQQDAALLTTFNECDMSAVMKLRKDVQDDFVAKHGVKLGFMSIFIKAVVDALKEVPGINARMDGDDLILNHFFDIGVAVGSDRGLFVPVIRDCDKKSFAQIEADIAGCAARARAGKLEFSDLQGGVFTISNGGIYGSMLSTPILNAPQSAILGMHNIIERPVAVDGEVVIRPMMYLALGYDHRIVDGKEAVTFLARVRDCVENPVRLLVGA
ncbi:MAG: 2-oxoglutarate dehydrogenase complex dihydrolipoyllysine-residue succinyltransferase [Verrucomicrobiales bacterium]